MNNNWIELYPSNWLYNAGVVGFLNVLSNYDNNPLFEFENNIVKIRKSTIYDIMNSSIKSPIEGIPFWHYWYVIENERKKIKTKEENTGKSKDKKKNDIVVFKGEEYHININDEHVSDENKRCIHVFLQTYYGNTPILFSKKGIYANYYPPSKLKSFDYFEKYFLKKLQNENNVSSKEVCSFCDSKKYELSPIDGKFMNLLMPSYTGFPNSFWNNSQDGLDKICALCQLLIIHHHLAFTKLSDESEIFINAPSFEVMYKLNKVFREISPDQTSQGKSPLDILGMTLIEYAQKIHSIMSKWTSMNIEIVVKKYINVDGGTIIDFYNLPSDIQMLLTDREIASLLSQIGEYSILKLVLEGRYEELLKIAYISTRVYIREVQANDKNNEQSWDFKEFSRYFEKRKNRERPREVLEKILSLYAKIKDRRVLHGS